MKQTINTNQLLSLINNTKERNFHIVNQSDSVINYRRLAKSYEFKKKYGEDSVMKVRAVVDGIYDFTRKSYGRRVNEALSENGIDEPFYSKARGYGKWVLNDQVMEHGGNILLRGFYDGSHLPSVKVYVGRKRISIEELESYGGYSGIATSSKRQMDMGMPQEDCVLIRVIKPSSIKEITIDGVEYKVR